MYQRVVVRVVIITIKYRVNLLEGTRLNLLFLVAVLEQLSSVMHHLDRLGS